NHDSVKDSTTPLYYDPKHTDGFGNLRPSLIVTGSPPASALEALEITSLAVLPNGSQKMLQYVVYGSSLDLDIPAALTFVGNGVQFTQYNSSFFRIDGNDQFSVGACTVGAGSLPAIGYTTASDQAPLLTDMSAHPDHFLGAGMPVNSLRLVSGSPPPSPK